MRLMRRTSIGNAALTAVCIALLGAAVPAAPANARLVSKAQAAAAQAKAAADRARAEAEARAAAARAQAEARAREAAARAQAAAARAQEAAARIRAARERVLALIDAGERCDLPGSEQRFLRWNDDTWYVPAPNGGFEATLPGEEAVGWHIFGFADVVDGNDPFQVLGGSQSLEMRAGSVVTSPTFCVDKTMPHFRYMMSPVHHGSSMLTLVEFRDWSTGGLWRPALSLVNATLLPNQWWPSDFSSLSVKIPSVAYFGKVAHVRIKFVTLTGRYRVDNVLLDPYRRR